MACLCLKTNKNILIYSFAFVCLFVRSFIKLSMQQKEEEPKKIKQKNFSVSLH